MPDLAVEYMPLADLVPYARNARTHGPAQVAQLVDSIREFGWTNPVLIDEAGGIIAGHGRVMAAQQLGMDQVPCIRLAHLTDTQRRAYVLADNRLALNAGWDDALLAQELAALRDADVDIGLTGFSDPEIERLLTFAPPSETRLRDIEALVDTAPTSTAEFERQMRDRDAAAALPIVPMYAEAHTAFVILCDNSIDEAWLRQRLRLEKPQASYKDVKPMRPDITTVAALRAAFSNG